MFESWPFTNFHDLNMDWIIKTIKVYTKKVDDLYNFGLYDYVEKVLAKHPEWTTTVQDGSIGYAKFTDEVKKRFKNRLIFMPVPWNDTGLNSDCTVISTSVGKNIMFDTGHPTYWNTIAQTLRTNGIDKIDVLVISHYHADHYANIENLITDGFVTGDTVVYLPKIGYLYPSQLERETATIGALTAAGVTYEKPDSGTQLLIDNVNIQFFNSNQDDMTYYDGAATGDENNYSMCCYVTCGDMFTMGIFGDIGMAAQTRVYEQGWIKKTDIAKITHHANDETADNNYYLSMMPDIGVAMQTAWLLRERQNTGYAYNVIPSYGGKMYSTGNGTIYAAFGEDGYYLEPNSENLSGGSTKTVSLYLDASYTGESDGSVNKPYPTLMQAVSAAKKYKGVIVDIEPVTSYASDEELLVRNAGNQITLKNLTIGNVFVYPGSLVNFSDVTLTKADDALTVNGATVQGTLTMTTSGTRGAIFRNARVNLERLTISNKTTGFTAIDNSSVFVATLEGENVTYAVSSNNGATVSIGTNNMSSTNKWDHNNELGGVLGDFDQNFDNLKTVAVTSVSKMYMTRRDDYNVVHLDIGVSLTSGVTQITSALPRELRCATPQRVPIVGRAGGAYATATNYIGELFIDNAHCMHLVFGNAYSSVNYVTCECIVQNLKT